jgi:sulfur relay (sulfurtransferase) complex TusBCD TusD component (DsrE family)
VTRDHPAEQYLLVATQSGGTAERFLTDAAVLAGAGERVRLFLAADGVALGIRGASSGLPQFLSAGGQAWIDEFTLAHRALHGAALTPGVRTTGMGDLADWLLEPGTRVVWH